jgi:2,4-dienoyl-CoA reductase-like NADH-dependent reductase (Old Yellow Enzyme family)
MDTMITLTKLSDPLKVNEMMLKNRLVMPPMHTGLATIEGIVTDDLIKHYAQRSSALGLLIVEHTYVSREGQYSERQLGVHEDGLIPGLRELSRSIHGRGTPAVLQLNHAGRKAREEVTGMTPITPSPYENTRVLREEEIGNVIEDFASAAQRAMRAGFDGVEVHGAHGFLLDQFYSPLSNARRDGYGGSLENRMRFPLAVVEKVRERIDDGLLLFRLGSDDLDPRGIRIEDSEIFASRLEDFGVDIIDVSGGMCGSRPGQLEGVKGYFIPQAQRIHKVVSVPVIGVGGITDPAYADRILRDGAVDLVAVGRALLEDPQWAEKAFEILDGKG